MTASTAKTGGVPLLRIYWYDGLLRGELSADQQRLASAENVKLRLGVVNVSGQQKGVDSLIVTDLVELARNHAITDAVVLSGDEDLRIGVQIAQSFGVRVHLIGIEPSRGSQSLSLLQEADTATEWNKAEICAILTLKPGFDGPAQTFGAPVSTDVDTDAAAALEAVIDSFVLTLQPEEIRDLMSLGDTENIPAVFDRRLLAMCGTEIGRYLSAVEKSQMRKRLRDRVSGLATNL